MTKEREKRTVDDVKKLAADPAHRFDQGIPFMVTIFNFEAWVKASEVAALFESQEARIEANLAALSDLRPGGFFIMPTGQRLKVYEVNEFTVTACEPHFCGWPTPRFVWEAAIKGGATVVKAERAAADDKGGEVS